MSGSFCVEGGFLTNQPGTWTFTTLLDAATFVRNQLAGTVGGIGSRWAIRMFVDAVVAPPLELHLPSGNHQVLLIGEGPSEYRTQVSGAAGAFSWLLGSAAGGSIILVRLDLRLTVLGAVPAIQVAGGVNLELDSCSARPVGPTAGADGILIGPSAAGAPVLRLRNTLLAGWRTAIRLVEAASLEVDDSAIVDGGSGLVAESAENLRVSNSAFEDLEVALDQVFPTPVLAPEHLVEDTRFVRCDLGVRLRYRRPPAAVAGGTSEPRFRYARCEFAGRLSAERTRPLVGMEVRFGRSNLPPSGIIEGGVTVESSVFHGLETGIELFPGPLPRVWLDHNTFAANDSRAVLVHAAAGFGSVAPNGGFAPGLVISNNLFVGDLGVVGPALPPHGGVEFAGGWTPTSTSTVPGAHPVVIAGNYFAGFAWHGFGPAHNMIFSRTTVGLQSHFTDPPWQALPNWRNHVGVDPVLAREVQIGTSGLVFDYHPMRSLGSPLVGASLGLGEQFAMTSWGYPAYGGEGFYGNERPSPVVNTSAPIPSIGAAEPAGWKQYPILLEGLGLRDPAALADIREIGDVATLDHAVAVDSTSPPSGDPVQDAPALFRMAELSAMAAVGSIWGLKVVGRMSIVATAAVQVSTTTNQTFTTPDSKLGGTNPLYAMSESDPYFEYWHEAALEFVRLVRADPTVYPMIAAWLGPDEAQTNLTGIHRDWGPSLLLRAAIDDLGAPRRPFTAFESSSSASYGGVIPATAAGTTGSLAGVSSPLLGSLYSIESAASQNLWTSRFASGTSATQESVSRPDPNLPLYTGSVATTEVSQLQVGYQANQLPITDDRGFLAAAYDALLVGNYLDYDLRSQRHPLGAAPWYWQNRVHARHRTEGTAEARANGQFLLAERSQSLLGLPLYHSVLLGWYFPEDDDPPPDPARLMPETPAYAAHDLLAGLPHANGVHLWSWFRRTVRVDRDWVDAAGNSMPVNVLDPHPGWAGYEEVLQLLKGTHPSWPELSLREFLVCGDRDFDLGFEIVVPTGALERDLGYADYSGRSGWVAPWPKLQHVVLQIRDVVLLIVTKASADGWLDPNSRAVNPTPDPPFTFRFGHSTLPAAAAEQLLTTPLGATSAVGASTSSAFNYEETMYGIGARIYRVPLA